MLVRQRQMSREHSRMRQYDRPSFVSRYKAGVARRRRRRQNLGDRAVCCSLSAQPIPLYVLAGTVVTAPRLQCRPPCEAGKPSQEPKR